MKHVKAVVAMNNDDRILRELHEIKELLRGLAAQHQPISDFASRRRGVGGVSEPPAKMQQMSELPEGYPPEWKRVVVMVSPQGEVHQIGGDDAAWNLLQLRLRPYLDRGSEVIQKPT